MKPLIARLVEMVEYMGLSVHFTDDLPDRVAGFLDLGDEPRYIAINLRCPHHEQAFTIAHELAHYVLHLGPSENPRRIPSQNNLIWKLMSCVTSKRRLTRYVAKYFNKERQADLYAYAVLAYCGASQEIQAITKQYPEKRDLFLLCITAYLWLKFKSLFSFSRD